MPAFGTCAGMILLAAHVARRSRRSAIASRRSTSTSAATATGARSIRSRPTIDVVGDSSAVPRRVHPRPDRRASRRRRRGTCLRRWQPGAVVSASVLVSSFHPELCADDRLHRDCSWVRAEQARSTMSGPFEMGDDQAQEGRCRQGAGQAVRQVDQAGRGGRAHRAAATSTPTQPCARCTRRRGTTRFRSTRSNVPSNAVPVSSKASRTRRSRTRAMRRPALLCSSTC